MNRPFDAKRYKRLLEGLEVTVVSHSAVRAAASTLRFDPEYFAKQHLADATVAASRNGEFVTFTALGLNVEGSAFYPAIEEFYGTGDLPFIRVADVDVVIDFGQCARIPANLCDRLPTLRRVHPGDIVFTKGGSVARVGLVTEEAAASRDLIFIDTSKLAIQEQRFLSTYFQTDYFNRMLVRSSSQTAQPHLTITLVRSLPIFKASDQLKTACSQTLEYAYVARRIAIDRMRQADATLAAALDLAVWQPPQPLSYTRHASQAFAAGRLDAEYFAPRVSGLLTRLRAGGRTIVDVAPARRLRFVPSRSGEFRYIEIGNIANDGTASVEIVAMSEAPSRATQLVRAGDVLTSTVRPVRRLSAIVLPEQDGAVASSGFVVLQPRAVAAEVLMTYLRLPLVCEVMDLHTSASLYPAISESDLLNLPFPEIGRAEGETIAKCVQDAHASRRRARELLAAAQRAVEIAIEQDEAAALVYLDGFDVAT